MKTIFSKIEYISLIVFIILAFFPWFGLLNRTGWDTAQIVISHITSVASVDAYAITFTLFSSIVTLILALFKKRAAIYWTLTFIAPLVGFTYGMIESKGKYLSSMELAYIMVVVISIVMLLKRLKIVKLTFIK